VPSLLPRFFAKFISPFCDLWGPVQEKRVVKLVLFDW